MMHSVFSFLTESTVTLSVLCLAYILLLKKLSHFQYMRAFLILTVFAGTFIGLFSFEIEHQLSQKSTVEALSLADYFPTFNAQEVEVESTTHSASWYNVLFTDWSVGVSFFYVLTMISVFIWQATRWIKLNNVLSEAIPITAHPTVLQTSAFNSPFTFRGKIYVPTNMTSLTPKEFDKVIAHEQAHVRFGHRYDVYLIELLRPLFWFNPVYWFLARELRKVHEYQVDEAIQENDPAFHYPDLLLKLASDAPRHKMVQGFAQHVIKSRIERLFHPKSHRMKKLNFLIALPIIGVCLNAFTVEHRFISQPTSAVKTSFHESRPFILPISIESIVRISPYGERKNPINQSIKLHKGIDFVAEVGTPIYATADGVVSSVESSDGGYGNKIEIIHENGIISRYAHLSVMHVSEGSLVRQGETIAECGNTGLSTGPHLHFEVIKDDKPVDPEQFLSLAPLHAQLAKLNVDRDALIVVIDAGHGGKDIGAVLGNVHEKDICLHFAQQLQSALKRAGIQSISVRNTDEFIALKDRTTLTQDRKEALYISLHANQSEGQNANGFEIYIPTSASGQHAKSKRFAQLVQRELSDEAIKSRGTKTANFTVLKSAQCPAVLIELGFITSSDDLIHLTDAGFQKDWAEKMVASIIKYTE